MASKVSVVEWPSPGAAPVPDPEAAAAVAMRAMARIAAAWRLRNEEAARLLDVSPRTWNRIKSGGWSGTLRHDQLLRASGLIGLYKALHLYFGDALADRWVGLPNSGPSYGGRRPVEMMAEGGLPAILAVRDHVDALRGGV